MAFPFTDMIVALAAAVVVLSVAVCGLSWLVYRLSRQNRRILARLDAIDGAVAEAGPRRAGRGVADRPVAASRTNRDGLRPGAIAPAFSLPTVDGRSVSLADYAGRRVLLVFSDPECGPCMELLPRLEGAARITEVPVLVISRGSVDANRRSLAEARSRLTVAMQANWEVSHRYANFATPIAYLVDEQGRIASEVAVGATSILSLLSVSGPDSRLALLPGQAPGSRLTH